MTKQALIVCPPGGGSPLREVAGLTLIERLLRQLSAAGIDEVRVVAAPGFVVPPPSSRVSARVQTVGSAETEEWKMAADGAQGWASHLLVIAGDLVVDQRLIEWLGQRDAPALVSAGAQGPVELLGVLDVAALQGRGEGLDAVPRVSLASFPLYWRERRGDIPFHLLHVADDAAAERAWDILLDHVDKRTKDLPAIIFDPPFENWLVRRLAPTRITPNQITVVTTLLGFCVAVLFWHGWLRLGILLAIAVEVLDGVDGKLARIKWMTSRVGELEHVFDFFYEMSWYLGLGGYLAGRGVLWAWAAALAICCSDLADQFAYVCFRRRGGGNLDEANLWLRRFRVVGGRRNVYAWILLPGILLGAPDPYFVAVCGWAAITAAVHWWCALVLPPWMPPAAAPVAASARNRTH